MALRRLRRTEAFRSKPPALFIRRLKSRRDQKAELSLIDAAAAQVADGFTLAGHRGSVTVVQLVLLGLFYEFTGQVEEKFLDVVGLFGRGLQIEHALGLSEVFSPLSENLPLLGQVYLITCRTESVRRSRGVGKKAGTLFLWKTHGG